MQTFYDDREWEHWEQVWWRCTGNILSSQLKLIQATQALLNGPWSSPLATRSQTIAAQQATLHVSASLSLHVTSLLVNTHWCKQVVMACSSHQHVGPRNEVGLIARPPSASWFNVIHWTVWSVCLWCNKIAFLTCAVRSTTAGNLLCSNGLLTRSKRRWSGSIE